MRLFVALPLSDEAAASLLMMQNGVPGARWQTREQLHLTLRFIGEVDGASLRDIDDALSAIDAPSFDLALKRVGAFGGRKPHSLWAGVDAAEPLHHLNRKIESALQRVGLPAENRKFSPHVTLARLKATPPGAVADFLSDHALYAGPAFGVAGFALYSSLTTPNGSKYVGERDYELRT
jgi:RNA 2',3'-cyclic 3'-phosphodiesterase